MQSKVVQEHTLSTDPWDEPPRGRAVSPWLESQRVDCGSWGQVVLGVGRAGSPDKGNKMSPDGGSRTEEPAEEKSRTVQRGLRVPKGNRC